MNTNALKATGLALALLLAPAASKAVEVLKTEDVSIDIGARMQLVGTFNNWTATDSTTGKGNRDQTQIYLFQQENRLKLGADLMGVKFHFESSFGNDSYANAKTGVTVDTTINTTTAKATNKVTTSPGNNQLYNLFELNAEIPVTDNTSVVAGVIRRPESVRDASSDENLLFTGESQLANLFFNGGTDLGVYAKTQQGKLDALFGVVQGTANLPERYIPERLSLPVPLIARVGFGTITDAPDRVMQQGFDKVEEMKWRVGAGGFWMADSNAGHSTLFGQIAGQAELTKGPFKNGNLMFSNSYNPFLAAGAYQDSRLDRLDNQYYCVNVNGQLRMPMGDNTLVAGAEWDFSQFIAKGMAYNKRTAANPSGGVLVDGNYYTYGQLTVQGGEAYLGYVAPKWWAATRVDVLVPDALLGVSTGSSSWGDQTQWEIILPALGYKINKYTTLTAELEHNLNSSLAVDSDGVYNLKTVPTEAVAPLIYSAYQMSGRLMLQVAF